MLMISHHLTLVGLTRMVVGHNLTTQCHNYTLIAHHLVLLGPTLVLVYYFLIYRLCQGLIRMLQDII